MTTVTFFSISDMVSDEVLMTTVTFFSISDMVSDEV